MPGRLWLRWSMFAAGWWFSVLLGLALVAVAVLETLPSLPQAPAAFWMIAGLILLGELRPVIVAGGYDPQGVVTSHAFVFAAIYLYGPWPGLSVLALATLFSEISRKEGRVEGPLQHRAVHDECRLGGSPDGCVVLRA